MKIFFSLFILILSSSFVHAESFHIDSFYYIDSAPKPNEIGSKILFKIDREVSCEGIETNKVFINKDSYKMPTTPYYLLRFWPSYFLKQAALVHAEVDVDLGRYDEDLQACEVGFKYEGSSAERWYEPHEFKVSDPDDSNPINTVYYQMYINARTPTYAPWVYADTDYSVSCDGVTTNRVIPSTNPNESGYTITDEFNSQANPNYSSENTRSFFDLLSGKIDQYTIGRYMPQLNGCMIYNVEFSHNNMSAEAIQVGKQMCIDAPEVCDLFSREELDLALQIGLEDGIEMCNESPETCGLFDQAALDSAFSMGTDEGIQTCIDSPESCGLFSQVDVDTSFLNGSNSGIQSCIDSPESCNLFNQDAVNDAQAQGILMGQELCKNDPALCGLFSQADIDKSLAQGLEEGIELGLQQGKQACIDNPETCGLYDRTDLHTTFIRGEHVGKAKCIYNPASCGLFNANDVNTLINENVTQTLDELVNQLPKGAIKSTCKKHPDSVLCVYDNDTKKHNKDDKKRKGKKKKGHEKHDD